jgi:hypothetical protein
MQISSNKAIITGNHYETFNYEKPYSFNYKVKHREYNTNLTEAERKERQNDYIQASKNRAIKKIYRLVKGNMYRTSTPHFITLTFNKEILDLKVANKLFGLFIKRYTYSIGHQVRYVAVPEFQKNGRVHYHMIVFNHDKYISPRAFSLAVWKNGGVDIQKGYRTKGLCRYMTKYITKSFEDIRYKGCKRYFFSLEEHTKIYKDEYSVKKVLEAIKDVVPESEIKFNLYDYRIDDKDVRKANPNNTVIKREYML